MYVLRNPGPVSCVSMMDDLLRDYLKLFKSPPSTPHPELTHKNTLSTLLLPERSPGVETDTFTRSFANSHDRAAAIGPRDQRSSLRQKQGVLGV